MGDHPDDLSPLRLGRAHPEEDPLAHSRLVRKGLRGECLINYEKVPVRRAVVFGKGSSSQQLRVHCFEIAGQNDLKIGSLKPAGIILSFSSSPTHRTKPTGEWQGK